MGLDQYLTAEKRLSKTSKIERQYIKYFNTITRPEDIESINSDGGLYISVYFDSKYICDDLDKLPKIRGQVGRIKTVKRDGDSFIIGTEAGYWRKANQIHNWFVEHCQGGIDECQRTDLTVAQLESLNSTIKAFGRLPSYSTLDCNKPSKRLISIAKQVLPTQGGFFFGSTDYCNYYFYDIKDTKQILKSIMKKSTINNWQLSYQASW